MVLIWSAVWHAPGVLVLQVTIAAIGKQLNAWHIPHSIASTSPENAFLKSFPDGKLPKVVLPHGDEVATVWADGTPKTGLALDYDVVIVDCSARSNMKDDENLKKVRSTSTVLSMKPSLSEC